MFPTLRAKLVFAFALVTSLTVLLSAVGMMFLLREREISAERERTGQISNSIAEQVRLRAANLWKADALSAFLRDRAQQYNVRFLLIDSKDIIISDTAGKLAGQSADQITRNGGSVGHSTRTGFGFSAWKGEIVFYPAGAVLVNQDYRVLMLVPAADIAGAWRGLLPRVVLSGTTALAVAIGVAYLLARSITRPVVGVTHASEEMARGRYDQHIPDQGQDEIGRLARAFNQMAHQVSRTHQAMRDLNGNVAHELRTPLTSIQGYSQALLDGAVRTPEEAQHAARVINDEAERMRRLVEDLLYLSRLESGQLAIERAPIRVPELLHQAAERIGWQLQDSGRELRVQTAIDVPPIQGDERRLEQVLANLLDNAVRHTPAGGRITLSARWSMGAVTITVHNTGSYIPPEHLGRIFERFYQVDAARSRDGGLRAGGLGLAIAHEIAAAHGGSLTAASDPTAGTEFILVLPTASTQPADNAARLPVPSHRAIGSPPPAASRERPAI